MTIHLRTPDDASQQVSSRTGLVIEDDIQRQEFYLFTETEPTPRTADPDRQYYPVDRSWSVTLSQFDVPTVPATYVRDADGEMIEEVGHHERTEHPDRTYILELNGPIKIYVRFTAAFEIATSGDWTTVSFPSETEVTIGARSFHTRPAGTITVPETVQGVATGIGLLSSSLKTLSCERSFPTLRGHPPQLRVGDELEVPDGIEPADSPVTVEVPPDLRSVLTVAPLAYYLGASVDLGDVPAIRGPDLAHRLGDGRSLFESVKRTLQRLFVLDAVVRTEGYYEVALDERDAVERRTSLDVPGLYGRPLHRQVDQYLSVAHDAVADLIPKWSLGADVEPTFENVSALPYLLDDLGLVRPYDSDDRDVTPPSSGDDYEAFLRGTSFDRDPARPSFDVHPEDRLSFRSLDEMDVEDHLWIGDGVPIDAAKFLRDGYDHALDWQSEGDIDVHVVCNHETMMEEVLEGRLYGDRDSVAMDVSVSLEETAEELRETFAAEHDFVHYIGHVRGRHFECADGEYLEAADVEEVNVGAFLINGCQSYRVGKQLVSAGSMGGIVTTSDVANRSAVQIGQSIAKLLNLGFSLNASLRFASRQHAIGNHYVTIGKVGTTLVPAKGPVPYSSEITETEDGQYTITIRTHPPRDQHSLGSLSRPILPGVDKNHLGSGTLGTYTVDKTTLFRFLSLGDHPVKFDGEWTETEPLLDRL